MAQTVTACQRCGSSVPVDAKFCPTCGAPQAERREERRVVTVLFGDLAGFTQLSEDRDPEEVKAVVDAAFEHLGQIIADHGGRVDKVIGDEIMAVFGAPQAHEDDPERTVRAALSMQRYLAAESERLEQERGIVLPMHIGINTGEVVAGFIGGSDSYTVVGDAVNTARRIEEAAEAGQILVGEPTRSATAEAISYRRVGAVAAKGKRLPVDVFEALAERGLPGERGARLAPLIGREEELLLLQATSAIVRRDRSPTIVTMVGEAGLGKSRLAEEFARAARGDGWRVLEARSLPYGTASPSDEVVALLRHALDLPRADTGDDLRGTLKERLDALGLASETDVLGAFLGLGGSIPGRAGEPPGTGAGPPGDARLALDGARAVLERVAEGGAGLILVLHDLHWGDDPVLTFVQELIDEARGPLFVLCVARPDLLERRPGWGTAVGSILVRLQPLSRERAAEMLDLLAPEMPLAIRESVLERAGGNPFYVQELARYLRDRPADATDAMDVPSGVQAMVAARLDALPEDVKRFLQDAAVVGEQFWTGALTMLGADPGALLGRPEVVELIEEDAGRGLPGDGAYRFRQTLVREVAYGSVPKQARAKHHAEIARWLEEATQGSAVERDYYDLIAHHYERAASLSQELGGSDPGAEVKAREYLERAGDQALGMDAARTAARFFRRALPFASNDADALGMRLRLAEALVGSFRHEEATEHLNDALAQARTLGDRRSESRALRLLGDSLRMTGHLDEAGEPLERALALARELGDEAEEAAGLRARGQLDLWQGKWQSSIGWFGQALDRFQAVGDRRGEGWSLQNLGWASMFTGDLDEALAYLERGEEIFNELGDDEGVGWCIGMRGWVQLQRGEVMEAGRIAEVLERYLREESPEYLLSAGFVLELQKILRAYVEVLRCHLDDATAIARSAVAAGESIGAAWVQALGHYPLFLAALLQRRFDAAREEVEKGAAGAVAMGDPFYKGQAEFARALLAIEEGRLDDAERSLAILSRDDERGKAWSATAGVTFLTARVARARGDLDGALAALERGGERQGIGLVSPPRLNVLRSELERERGDAEAAILAAEQAVEASGEETLARVLALRALAEAHLIAGKPVEGEAAIRDELQVLDETDWTLERIRALAVLARALDDQRRFDESSEVIDDARAAIDALPPDAHTGGVEELLRA